MSRAYNTLFVALVSSAALAMPAQFAEAQTPTNAALKARAKMQERHRQTGSIGSGYRPWSAWAYQQSARAHTQALNAYGQNAKQLPASTAREHLKAIQQNVAATREEIGKLGGDAAKKIEVQKQVVALQQHLKECEQLCGVMEKTITGDGVDTVKMCAHCSGLEAKLKAADAAHEALLKELGIEPPASAAAHGDLNHEHETEARPEQKQ